MALEWHRGEASLELEVLPDGHVAVFHTDTESGLEWEGDLEALAERVHKALRRFAPVSDVPTV
ncbi:MAG: hypothetical protein FJ029_11910 [Actinobacteria bacterium]|nr:hypothetical protein [Actinomycetota bacterium]